MLVILKMFWNELLPNFIKNIIKFFMLNRYMGKKYTYEETHICPEVYIFETIVLYDQIVISHHEIR